MQVFSLGFYPTAISAWQSLLLKTCRRTSEMKELAATNSRLWPELSLQLTNDIAQSKPNSQPMRTMMMMMMWYLVQLSRISALLFTLAVLEANRLKLFCHSIQAAVWFVAAATSWKRSPFLQQMALRSSVASKSTIVYQIVSPETCAWPSRT